MYRIGYKGDLQERFWSKVNTSDECWEWQGARSKSGYGIIWNKGENCSAHRISWELFNSQIPEKTMVLHHCDNKTCVNPKHLFLGTAKDNTRDSVNKNREYFKKGEGHPDHLFTNAQIREIRASPLSQYRLSKQYRVSEWCIHNILKRISYKDAEYA